MYQLGLYEKSMPNHIKWKEKMSLAKDAGFDFLEMSIDETVEKQKRLNMSAHERFHLVKEMQEMNMPIRSICLSAHRKYPLGHPNVEIQEKSLEIMSKAIDLADDLGIRYIQLAGYDVYYEESNKTTKEIFSKNLRKAVSMASKKGVVLAFETMETEFMDTIEKSMKYIREIKSPYLKSYPDIGNLKNASLKYGTSVNEDLVKGRGEIVSAHLKETLPEVYREIKFGEGHTDFFENITELKNQGVNRFVAEFWHDSSDDWKSDLKYSNEFLREILDDIYK